MGYELSDLEWTFIKPMLPNKPRGVPHVNDRRVLNGIFWVLRSGAPWRNLPESYGPPTTCYNRFVRWRRAGVWDRIMAAVAAAHDPAVQIIDRSWSSSAPWPVARRGSRQHVVPSTSVGIAFNDNGACRPWLRCRLDQSTC
jgi:transposase